MTTSGTTRDDNVVIMTTLSFQCYKMLDFLKINHNRKSIGCLKGMGCFCEFQAWQNNYLIHYTKYINLNLAIIAPNTTQI